MIGKAIVRAPIRGGLAAALSLFCMPAAWADDVIALPSGLGVTVQEVIFEKDPAVARFRFVAPDLGAEGTAYADIKGDFPWLCQEMILPALTEPQKAGNIVISLADRPVVFGQITPEATQFFEMFRVEGDLCIWEGF